MKKNKRPRSCARQKKASIGWPLRRRHKTPLLRCCEGCAYFLSATGAGAAATFSAFLSALCAFFSAFFSSLAAFMSALASTFAGAVAGAAGAAAGAWAKTPAAKKPAINVASNLFMRNTPSFQLSAQHCVEPVHTTRCLAGLMTRCQSSCNVLYQGRKYFEPPQQCMIHVKQICQVARHRVDGPIK